MLSSTTFAAMAEPADITSNPVNAMVRTMFFISLLDAHGSRISTATQTKRMPVANNEGVQLTNQRTPSALKDDTASVRADCRSPRAELSLARSACASVPMADHELRQAATISRGISCCRTHGVLGPG